MPSRHVRGMKGYGYGMKDENALMQYHRHVRDWLDSPQLRLVLTTQRTSQIRHPQGRTAAFGGETHKRRFVHESHSGRCPTTSQ